MINTFYNFIEFAVLILQTIKTATLQSATSGITTILLPVANASWAEYRFHLLQCIYEPKNRQLW